MTAPHDTLAHREFPSACDHAVITSHDHRPSGELLGRLAELPMTTTCARDHVLSADAER